MKKNLLKVIGLAFVLALVFNSLPNKKDDLEFPPLLGANTVTQLHIS